jgi:hypothetical protein
MNTVHAVLQVFVTAEPDESEWSVLLSGRFTPWKEQSVPIRYEPDLGPEPIDTK